MAYGKQILNVHYAKNNRVWVCTVDVICRHGNWPTSEDAEKECSRRYDVAIDCYCGGLTCVLPDGVVEKVSPAGIDVMLRDAATDAFCKQTKPRRLKDFVCDAGAAGFSDLEELAFKTRRFADFYGTGRVNELLEPKTESGKPEGTRDVDKFLKEQQDKLWKDMI